MNASAKARDYAVAFADVAGSTRLYETAGDAAAKTLIGDLEAEIAGVIARMGGFVQEIVGDEVLFRFDDVNTAVACTFSIQEATEIFSAGCGTPMSVRVGLHYGSVIVDEGGIYGDTVNTSARMAAIALGGQIIASGDVVKRLAAPLSSAARRFDRVKVKGKRDPIVIYDLLWHPSNVTEIHPSALPGSGPVATLTLRYEDRCAFVEAGREFSIGRAPDNDLVVMSGSVSRKHATLDFGRDRFILLDKSTNGTYVETENGETVFLRREAFPLWGRGRIALGAPAAEGIAHLIEFEC